MSVTVLLADDHPIVRQGLRHLLEAEPNLRVVGEASNGLDAVRLVEKFRPDVLIVDIVMPELNGLEVLKQVKERFPETCSIVLSMRSADVYVVEALKAGALGYVLKETGPSELVNAVHQVIQGQRYLSPRISERLIDVLIESAQRSTSDPYQTLTNREREVLQMAAEGLTSAEVAKNAAALDFETTPAFALTVQATDAGGHSSSATVTVNLTKANEAPVVSGATFAIAENSTNGTPVGSVLSSDPDAGDTRTFAITAGNTGGAFAIDPATGAITVANGAALNFETTPSFNLTVRATDAGGLTGSATVTVNLTNANEAPSVTAATFSLAENSANGTAVGIVAASDPDAGDTRTFAISANNTGGAFAIDPATGAITVGSPT